MDGHYVWYGTIIQNLGSLSCLFFSFGEEEPGFDAWVTHSKIGYLCGSTIENGNPFSLLCACMKEIDEDGMKRSFNVRLPLR